MKLIVVESPTKSRTIKRFLDKDYQIVATSGHIRDLPEKKFGVDIKKDFRPTYVTISRKKEAIKKLKDLQKKAKKTILATDPDREGEAIAWHVVKILGLKEKNYQRIVFHEITKQAIKKALENPKKIDIDLVNAQQARRILDRIVGYKLSPFLWKKIVRGLSAGRVQSVTTRLIVERERDIKNFVPQEYWTIVASLLKIKSQISPKQSKLATGQANLKNNKFEATLIKRDGKTIPKLGIKSKKEAHNIFKDLKGAEYKVENLEKKEAKRNPLPPFTTSTLQQEAWRRFHWPAKMTMGIAQNLYERGLISYHRTDSLNLSQQSLKAAKRYIIKNLGKEYFPGTFRKFKTKSKGAQEAHEAIRPTSVEKTPKALEGALDETQHKLYDLIWRRFIACQMSQAVFNSTTVDIEAKKYIFRATGQTLKFDGFLKVYPIKYKEAELPELEKEEVVKLIKLIPSQHFTQPPPRYSEATLIKELEKNGIGRPSTYAPIISVIQKRNYVKKNEQKKFYPTEIGVLVNDLLVEHFPKIVNIKFTAKMEEGLDKIAEGKKNWKSTIKEFYEPFSENLKIKEKEISKKELTEQKTDKPCPKCGKPLVIKLGKFGKFLACSGFPKCKYSQPLGKEKKLKEKYSGQICDKCGAPMIVKYGKFGPFLACTNPRCKKTKSIAKSTGMKCPKCKKGEILEKRTKKGKIFYGCSKWPECDFALWDKPTGEKCPKCKSLLIKSKKGEIKCSNKECDYIGNTNGAGSH